MQCSFCGRTGSDLRLFSAPTPDGRRASICAPCIKSLGEATRQDADEPVDLLEQMARRMRLGLREPDFVCRLADQYLSHAREAENPQVADYAGRWKALAEPGTFDEQDAETLRQEIIARAHDDDLCQQLQRPYETWLRMMRIEDR